MSRKLYLVDNCPGNGDELQYLILAHGRNHALQIATEKAKQEFEKRMENDRAYYDYRKQQAKAEFESGEYVFPIFEGKETWEEVEYPEYEPGVTWDEYKQYLAIKIVKEIPLDQSGVIGEYFMDHEGGYDTHFFLGEE